MTNNNENEATRTDELSAEVAHKIGVEMGLWRMSHRTVSVQSHEVLLEYITQLENEVRLINKVGMGTSDIDLTQIYRRSENLVHDKAMKRVRDVVIHTSYSSGYKLTVEEVEEVKELFS